MYGAQNIFQRSVSAQNTYNNPSRQSVSSSYQSGTNSNYNNSQLSTFKHANNNMAQILGSYRIQSIISCPQLQSDSYVMTNKLNLFHLHPVEVRLQDYYLIRKHKLKPQHQNKIREAVRNKCMNQNILTNQDVILQSYSSFPKINIDAVKSGRCTISEHFKQSNNCGNRNYSSYNGTHQNSQNDNRSHLGNSINSFNRQGSNFLNTANSNNSLISSNFVSKNNPNYTNNTNNTNYATYTNHGNNTNYGNSTSYGNNTGSSNYGLNTSYKDYSSNNLSNNAHNASQNIFNKLNSNNINNYNNNANNNNKPFININQNNNQNINQNFKQNINQTLNQNINQNLNQNINQTINQKVNQNNNSINNISNYNQQFRNNSYNNNNVNMNTDNLFFRNSQNMNQNTNFNNRNNFNNQNNLNSNFNNLNHQNNQNNNNNYDHSMKKGVFDFIPSPRQLMRLKYHQYLSNNCHQNIIPNNNNYNNNGYLHQYNKNTQPYLNKSISSLNNNVAQQLLQYLYKLGKQNEEYQQQKSKIQKFYEQQRIKKQNENTKNNQLSLIDSRFINRQQNKCQVIFIHQNQKIQPIQQSAKKIKIKKKKKQVPLLSLYGLIIMVVNRQIYPWILFIFSLLQRKKINRLFKTLLFKKYNKFIKGFYVLTINYQVSI